MLLFLGPAVRPFSEASSASVFEASSASVFGASSASVFGASSASVLRPAVPAFCGQQCQRSEASSASVLWPAVPAFSETRSASFFEASSHGASVF